MLKHTEQCMQQKNLWRIHQRPVSRKSRKLFGPEKPFLKLRPASSVKLVFSYVVKGVQIKIIPKFRASRRVRFEDTTEKNYVTRNAPKKFRDFRETGAGRQGQQDYSQDKPLIKTAFPISRAFERPSEKEREEVVTLDRHKPLSITLFPRIS